MHLKKFRLALCELHCAKRHGGKENCQYLVIDIFDTLTMNNNDSSDSEEEEEETMEDLINDYNEEYNNMQYYKNPHRIIRNYLNIISRPNYIKPEIILKVKTREGYTFAILKTFWIRIIQRMWKKVFAQRQSVIEKRKQINNIMYRQLNGNWSFDCRVLPRYRLNLYTISHLKRPSKDGSL